MDFVENYHIAIMVQFSTSTAQIKLLILELGFRYRILCLNVFVGIIIIEYFSVLYCEYDCLFVHVDDGRHVAAEVSLKGDIEKTSASAAVAAPNIRQYHATSLSDKAACACRHYHRLLSMQKAVA